MVQEALARGELITHIAQIFIVRASGNIEASLKDAVYKALHKKSLLETVRNQAVTITWKASEMLGIYYTNSIYNDTYTAVHLKQVLQVIVNDLKRQHEYASEWGIFFLLTKPLECTSSQLTTGQII